MNIINNLKKFIIPQAGAGRPKIGLALGSGGARGLSHIGVFKILEKNNIPIDFIAGASIGAVMGGFYAAGKKADEIEKIAATTDLKKFLSLLDPALKTGLLRGDKAQKFIEENINKIKFNELKIPLTVVATDYISGKPIMLNKGDVAAAIRASMSVPIAFKLSNHEETLLIDGGLSIPIPVEAVRQMGADIVIAVNLDGDYFSYGHEKNINILKVAINSMNLLRHHLAEANIKNADIVINPKVGNILWYEFVTGKKAITAGEDATKEKISQIRKIIQIKTA